MPQRVQYQLSDCNGLQLATATMPDMESVAIGLYIPVGSRHEKGYPQGISHFVEHMIFKGTGKRNALQIAMETEGAGATVNAFTTEDHTCVEFRGPVSATSKMLDLLADMVWHSTYPEDEVEQECDVIAEEIVMYQESPSEHLHDLLSQALWPNSPLGYSITGTEETINEIDASLLHEFTQRFYRQRGMTLAVSGPVTHAEIELQVRQIAPELNQAQTQVAPYTDKQVTQVHEQRDLEQVHIGIGYHIHGRKSPQRHAVRLMSLILGETMSSWLFQELREKQALCYSIASDYSVFEDTGSFQINAGLDANRFEEALIALRCTLDRFLNDGPTQAELDQAKYFAINQSRISLEGTQSQMNWVGDCAMCYSEIFQPEDTFESVQAVTLKQLREAAKSVLSAPCAIATISCHSDEKMQEFLSNLFVSPAKSLI